MTTRASAGGDLRPRLAWTLLAVELFLFAGFGAVFYSPLTPHAIYVSNGPITGFWLFPFFSFSVAGAVLASRRPDHPLGWWCLGSIAVLLLGAVAALTGSLLAVAHHGTASRYVLPISVLWNSPAVPALAGMFIALLLFPDGRLSSPRWRWLVRALAVEVAAGIVVTLIDPSNPLGMNSDASPLAVPAARGVVDVLVPVIRSINFATGLVAMASVFLRLRGADAERRHQIRWVAFGGAVAVGVFVAVSVIPFSNSSDPGPWTPLVAGLLVTAGVALPATIAVAVLKYRLYDIDVVISRALVYTSLAVFITAVYVGIAVGVGALAGGGGRPNLALSILATAIVAVGFQPVRERVQHLANRLVYGRRATPYEVLSEFSQHAAEPMPRTRCCRAWPACCGRAAAPNRQPSGCARDRCCDRRRSRPTARPRRTRFRSPMAPCRRCPAPPERSRCATTTSCSVR
jgi:hypothetical protein